MSIWAHTLVKNEERYLWFAVTSVINWVDKVMLWDTGSTDSTPYIIEFLQKLYPDKILFKEVGDVDIQDFTNVRQQMLEETKADWTIIVDGDEVWWDSTIAELVDTIEENPKTETVVNSYRNLIGDIFHYQPESAGKYKIDDRVGHLTIRAMNMKIPGLKVSKPHGTQGFFDGNGQLIQERSKEKRIHINDLAYLHFTHLIRSSSLKKDLDVPKRDIKYKYELGIEVPKDYYYPEAFFRPRPEFMPSPWQTMSKEYFRKAALVTIPKRIKRKINLFERSGY